MNNDGHGGSYTIDEAGERVQTQPPTQNHPDGNAPRPAPDTPNDPASTASASAAADTTKPKPKGGK